MSSVKFLAGNMTICLLVGFETTNGLLKKMSNHVLPPELQTLIIKFIPEEDWLKIINIPCLENGLRDKTLWKVICADKFGDSLTTEIIELLKANCGDSEQFFWHNALWVSNGNINDLLCSLTKLKVLDLTCNAQVQAVDFLCSYEQLAKLSLNNCISLNRYNLMPNILCSRNLTYLDISESCKLQPIDIVRISKRLKKLNYINIRECVSLTHEIVRAVELNLSKLDMFLFCVMLDVNDTTPWVDIYLSYPKLQICPAALDIILEQNPHLLQ